MTNIGDQVKHVPTLYKLAKIQEMERPEINVTSYPDNSESDREGDYNSNAIKLLQPYRARHNTQTEG